MMTFFIIVLALVVAFFLILFFGGEVPSEQIAAPVGYTQDIDWSLMVKGYPVVNDVDIQFSDWLAANPEKIV